MIELYDNGHGVNTPGKCSPDRRFLEYKNTRRLVKDIVAKRRAMGYDARILVPEENDISLSERCRRVNAICKEHGKDNVILISVHHNAAPGSGWSTASGFCGYVAPKSSAKSKLLAQCLYEAAAKRKLKGNRSVPACKYWTGNFAIIRDTLCPAVLTENLFQNNEAEVDFLLSAEGHKAIVDLHVEGVENYLKSISK